MSSVLDSSTAVWANCGTDHNPVVIKLRIKLKLPCKETKKKLPDWDNISPKTVEEMQGTLEETLGNVNQSKMLIEETYGIFVRAINEDSECVPKSKKQNQKSWITEEIVELMEMRRKAKSQVRMDDYRLIHSRVLQSTGELPEYEVQGSRNSLQHHADGSTPKYSTASREIQELLKAHRNRRQ